LSTACDDALHAQLHAAMSPLAVHANFIVIQDLSVRHDS